MGLRLRKGWYGLTMPHLIDQPGLCDAAAVRVTGIKIRFHHSRLACLARLVQTGLGKNSGDLGWLGQFSPNAQRAHNSWTIDEALR
jgi:hypothetical protein